MNTITKVMLSAVVVLLLMFAGVVVYRLVGGVTLDQLASNPTQSLTEALSPAQTLEDALRERAKECSPEMQAAFVEGAMRTNDSFEDSYLLAMSSARIGLTPVVRDMQQLERDMAALETDACSEPVQAELVEAYNAVIDGVMGFMVDNETAVDTYSLEGDLRNATTHLELYTLSPEALLYDLDTSKRSEAIREGKPIAPELAYLKAFNALDAHTQCVQHPRFGDYYMQAYRAARNRFSLISLDDLGIELPEAPSEDSDPCADIPVVANPKPVTVEYQLAGSGTQSTAAEYVWITLPAGESFYAETLKLPYTRTVEMMTGHPAQISGMAALDARPISCAILVDGKIVKTRRPAPMQAARSSWSDGDAWRANALQPGVRQPERRKQNGSTMIWSNQLWSHH